MLNRGRLVSWGIALGMAATACACRPTERARVQVRTLATTQTGSFTLEAGAYSVWEDLDVAQGASPPGSPTIQFVKRVDQCFAWSIELEQAGKVKSTRCAVFEPGERNCRSSMESGGTKHYRYCRVPSCSVVLASSGPTTLRATLERRADTACQHLQLEDSALILARKD